MGVWRAGDFDGEDLGFCGGVMFILQVGAFGGCVLWVGLVFWGVAVKFWRQGRGLRGAAWGGGCKRVVLFELSDRGL